VLAARNASQDAVLERMAEAARWMNAATLRSPPTVLPQL
jgi:hypothetical protein